MAAFIPLLLVLSQPRERNPDDGYRLLDGHYVGRIGCDNRGTIEAASQPTGNLTLPECKARCNANGSCRGLSYHRAGMHVKVNPPTNCLLKRKCVGRVDTKSVCEPDATFDSGPDCTLRRSNVFTYMRVVPLQRRAAGALADDAADEPTALANDDGAASWASSFARLKPAAARVGLLYLNLGAGWGPWTRFILRAAAANREVDFYFLGAPLDLTPCAHNCARLPLSLGSLRARIRRHLLNDSRVDQFGAKGNAARKLCDLVPMWPALFPEVSARHKFIGITEQDMLPGNLTAELARLRDEDDMLLPLERFPQPLTDANFMVYRTIPKMLQAFRRVPNWQQVITSNKHMRFDEWVVEPPSVMVAFQEMLFASELRVQPAQRFLVQDVIIIRKRRYPRIDDYGATVTFRWRSGALVVEREGPCICPRDVVPIYGITCCLECFHNPGVVLPTKTRRKLEVMGFHFSAWKRRWKEDPQKAVPDCPAGANFDLAPEGFKCVG